MRIASLAFMICILGSLCPAALRAQVVKEELYEGKTVHQWVADLANEKGSVRLKAAKALGAMGPKAKMAVGDLLVALRDEDAGVRATAAASLGQMGDVAGQATPAILMLLRDKQAMVRVEGAIALWRLAKRPRISPQSLVKELSCPDVAVRLRATEGLGGMGAEARPAVLVLAKLLRANNTSPQVILSALGQIGPGAVQAVPAVALSLNDADKTVRLAAAEVLAKVGPGAAPAVPALSLALNDKDKAVRLQTLTALGKIGVAAKAGVPVVVRALKDPDAEVRGRAVETLEIFGRTSRKAIEALAEALRDATLRAKAGEALGRIGRPAVAVLAMKMGDKDDQIRLSAVDALQRMGRQAQPAALGFCKLIRADKNPAVRAMCVRALGSASRGEAKEIQALVAGLIDKEKDVRCAAAEALSRFGPKAPKAIPALRLALQKDPVPEVRTKAAQALGTAGGGKKDVAALIAALDDKDDTVRQNAAIAIRSLGVKAVAAVPKLRQVVVSKGSRFVRNYAVQALGAMGPLAVDSLGELVEALDDSFTQLSAIESLSKLGAKGRPAAASLQLLTNHKEKAVQIAAKDALKKIFAAKPKQ